MDGLSYFALRSVGLAIASGLAAWFLTGCTPTRTTATAAPGTQPTVVVLDFEVLPRLKETRDENRERILTPTAVETTRDRRGWWLTSQNVYTNANAGRLLADELSRELARNGPLTPLSREDLKIYMADKAEVLRDTLKLEDKDARRATGALDPIRVGREMGADRVIRGQVVDMEMRHSRVFGVFGAGGSARIAVINTRTGQAEVVSSARIMRFTGTTLSAAEGLARQLADQIREHYQKTGVR